jgi:uncharacterized membrane protein
MSVTRQQQSEERFEKLLGNLLRTGVLVAAAVVLVGAVVYLVRHGRESVNYKDFRGEPADLRNVMGLSGRGLIQFGLLVLVATPVLRVILSVVGFARQRDFLYVVLTLIVLVVLSYSLFFGTGL